MAEDWIKDVLGFWFEELTPEQWFKRSDAVDETIVARFSGIYDAVRAREAADLVSSAEQALAAVIVLDQFPRNMYRNSARSFESDAMALEVSERAIAAGFDDGMPDARRHFLYMPFMHSEELDHQDRCITLFESLGQEDGLKFAHLHRDIIVKFGRFPHRNAVLDRPTTPDEQAHLDVHGGF